MPTIMHAAIPSQDAITFDLSGQAVNSESIGNGNQEHRN
jgi:hypothetical protein